MNSNYKKYIRKKAKKVAKESRIAIRPLAKGNFQYIQNSLVNGFNGTIGDIRIKRLVKKLDKNCISYSNERRKFKSDYPWSDYYVISGLTIPGMIKKGFVDPDVALAYQYQFPEKANSMTFTDAWLDLDTSEEKLGFVSAVKGKLFEIKYLNEHISKTLEPGYTAKLAESPTQKAFDIEIYNPYGQIDQQLQLKASQSASYVKEALNKYPEIDVVTLEDLEGQMLLTDFPDRIVTSSISDESLLSAIGDATGSNLNYLPILGFVYLIFSSYTKKEASKFEKTVTIGRRASDYGFNLWILATTGGVIGIPLVAIKHFFLRRGEHKTETIAYLKKQLKRQKRTHKRIKQLFNRRDFLKGLAITPIGLQRNYRN